MFATTSLTLSARLRPLARWACATIVATLVAACGGGGEDGDTGQSSPIISTQPSDVSAVAGNSVNLNVVAFGSAPLQYRWSSSLEGVTFAAIAGATSSTYGTGTTTVAQNGTR